MGKDDAEMSDSDQISRSSRRKVPMVDRPGCVINRKVKPNLEMKAIL